MVSLSAVTLALCVGSGSPSCADAKFLVAISVTIGFFYMTELFALFKTPNLEGLWITLGLVPNRRPVWHG